jgi:hypothetical protein
MSQRATAEEERSPSSAGLLRIVIVDDHPIVRKGLTELIKQQPDMAVCGEADTVDGGGFKPPVPMSSSSTCRWVW